MDPEFQKALSIVLVVGLVIAAIGTGGLILFFRMFGTKEAGRSSHIGLVAALIGFIFLCCIGLFAVAFLGQ